MFPARAIVKHGLLALLVYALLLLAWPLVRLAYRPLFQAAGEFLFAVADPFGGEIRVRLESSSDSALAKDTPHMDTLVHLQHRRFAGADSLAAASSFFHGYQPTAFLLALFLGATNLSWSLRRKRLLWALVLLQIFVGLRLYVGVFYAYARSQIDGRPAIELSAGASRCLFWLWHFTWAEPIATYVVPLTIWALFAFAERTLAAGEEAGV